MTLLDRSSIIVSMNKLNTDKRVQILSALVEGNSINSTVRMTGAAKNTVLKLLRDIGQACQLYSDRIMVNLALKRVQVDEIWSFCYAREKNVPKKYKGQFGYGDVWTWVAMDADTKLVPVWLVGPRTLDSARHLLKNLAIRITERIQLTTDCFAGYYTAVYDTFKREIDYAQLMKVYDRPNIYPTDYKLSQSRVAAIITKPLMGNPDPKHIATSYVERQNLTMRTNIKRFTRLTNGFSKKIDNLACAVALHFTYYNFCRKHASLGISPAMAAGLSDHLWNLDELLDLLNEKRN